ncbi:hypothetical protein Hanom_Chr10g00921961 [Helianthus anomalus]
MEDNDESEFGSTSGSDSESVDDQISIGDIEEGEIRPVVQNMSEGQDVEDFPATEVREPGQSEVGGIPPVANEQSKEGGESPKRDQGINDNMENPKLHGEGISSIHVQCHVENNDKPLTPELTNNVDNGLVDGGPVRLSSIEDWFGGDKYNGPKRSDGVPEQLGRDMGPTPINCLGKRSRAVRSPPSLGSIQGPAQRSWNFGGSCGVPRCWGR